MLEAQIAAYAALVNTLKSTDAINVDALLDRLNGYAELMQEQRPIAFQMLTAQAATISGQVPDMKALAKILH